MSAASEAAHANEKGLTLVGLLFAYYKEHASSLHVSGIVYPLIVAALLVVLAALSVYVLSARSKKPRKVPTILLAGPANSGKTALFAKWQETPVSAEVETVTSVKPNEDKYRLLPHLTLVDTPGHEKLAQYVRNCLAEADVKAAVFVLDAASGESEIKQAARPLMAVLEAAERRAFPVLVAANKFDLFNSLSVNKIRSLLEAEIDELRTLKARDVQSSENSDDTWQQDEFLGLDGKKFEFGDLMNEVSVLSGSVQADRLSKWEEWLEATV